MQYLTVEIVLAKRKTSLITVFPQLLETFEGERFNWDKAWKKENMNQNNAFCLPLIGFSTQSSQYQIWKANMYSILTNGNRTWTTSVEVIHLNFKVLWPHWFWTWILWKKNQKLIIHRFRTGIYLTGNLPS